MEEGEISASSLDGFCYCGLTPPERPVFKLMTMVRSVLPAAIRNIVKAGLPAKVLHAYRVLRHGILFPVERELRFVPRLLNRNEVAVDIGANVGLFTRVLARTSRKVIAFEPHPHCAGYLRQLDMTNCQIVEAAVTDRSGLGTLQVPVSANQELRALSTIERANDFRRHSGVDGIVEHLVPTTTLDDALAALLDPSDRIGFIKIDIEGHEFAALTGAQGVIDRNRPALLIETEFRHGAHVKETFDFFKQRDYRSFALIDGHALSPIDVEQLRSLQSEERLARKLSRQRYFGYINNVFFLPSEKVFQAF